MSAQEEDGMKSITYAGIPDDIYESARRMLILTKEGRIKQHLLGDTSQTRYGTIEDRGMNSYRDFLRTKLCCEILNLEGKEEYEEH